MISFTFRPQEGGFGGAGGRGGGATRYGEGGGGAPRGDRDERAFGDRDRDRGLFNKNSFSFLSAPAREPRDAGYGARPRNDEGGFGAGESNPVVN